MTVSVSPDEICIISIGRGSRLTPKGSLSDNSWALFGMSVRNLYTDVYFEGLGTGTWAGSSEESFTIIGKLSDDARAGLDDTPGPRITARKFKEEGYVFAIEATTTAVVLTLYHHKSPVYGDENWSLRVRGHRRGTTGCNLVEYLPKRFQVRPN